ncbi:MAG: hypothetical protein RL398_1953 [Planctomycetota bacterium]|jgi:hypothetical protein
MSYDPRTIAFSAEILYPPQQLRPDLLQGLHNNLFRQPAIGYQNFQVAPDGVHLTNLPQAPGQVSSATFQWDRLILREELRGATVEDFATRVVNVTSQAIQALGLPTTLASQFVIRSLVAPRHFRDGREFLSRRLVAPNGEGWQEFGRPLQAGGVRFLFPPHGEHRDSFQVRIETWPQDPRSLWLENTGSFPMPLPTPELPKLAAQLDDTYRFLTGPVSRFLAELDTP